MASAGGASQPGASQPGTRDPRRTRDARAPEHAPQPGRADRARLTGSAPRVDSWKGSSRARLSRVARHGPLPSPRDGEAKRALSFGWLGRCVFSTALSAPGLTRAETRYCVANRHANKALRRHIHQRMASTGESYQTALEAIRRGTPHTARAGTPTRRTSSCSWPITSERRSPSPSSRPARPLDAPSSCACPRRERGIP